MTTSTTDSPAARLNSEGLAMAAGWLTVYSIDPVQREYQRATIEYLPVGVGLPALSFVDKPDIPPAGFAMVRRDDGAVWEIKPDYRGEVVYSTASGEPVVITAIGELPKEVTTLPPQTPFDQWDGKKWVTDTTAQRKASVQQAGQDLAWRQQEAANVLSPLEKAVKLNMATDSEKKALTAWETYTVLLSRVNVDAVPDIVWPEIPA